MPTEKYQINLTKYKIVIKHLKGSNCFRKYNKIIKLAEKSNFYRNPKFQKHFNDYFAVNHVTKAWKVDFFSFFETAKKKNLNFETALVSFISYKHGSFSPSFISKMIHVLHPERPIIDSHIASQIGGNGTHYHRYVCLAQQFYNELILLYLKFLQTNKAKKIIAHFDKNFPKYQHFSSLKKIDFLLLEKDRLERKHKYKNPSL